MFKMEFREKGVVALYEPYLDNGWESHKIRLKPVSPISVKIIRSDGS